MARATSPRLLLAALVALCALLALPSPSQAKRKQGATCANTQLAPTAANLKLVRAAVLCLHNRERAARGLPKLSPQRQLRRAAKKHSQHMVRDHFFAHDVPGGADMTSRILGAGYARGRSWSLGENIAWGTNELATPAQIHLAWMRSPGHKANILRRQFREVGIGIAIGAPVRANDQSGATYTADFGVRR